MFSHTLKTLALFYTCKFQNNISVNYYNKHTVRFFFLSSSRLKIEVLFLDYGLYFKKKKEKKSSFIICIIFNKPHWLFVTTQEMPFLLSPGKMGPSLSFFQATKAQVSPLCSWTLLTWPPTPAAQLNFPTSFAVLRKA